MSKAFTKDDSAEPPLVVPARAPLPAGLANYVTPRGLGLLREELNRQKVERTQVDAIADPAERRHAQALLAARQAELEARLASAVLVDPATQPRDEVRFGAVVTVHTAAGVARQYKLVGVDEADGAHGLVAFTAPLARALLGRRVGELATLRSPRGEEELEVVTIRYDDA